MSALAVARPFLGGAPALQEPVHPRRPRLLRGTVHDARCAALMKRLAPVLSGHGVPEALSRRLIARAQSRLGVRSFETALGEALSEEIDFAPMRPTRGSAFVLPGAAAEGRLLAGVRIVLAARAAGVPADLLALAPASGARALHEAAQRAGCPISVTDNSARLAAMLEAGPRQRCLVVMTTPGRLRRARLPAAIVDLLHAGRAECLPVLDCGTRRPVMRQGVPDSRRVIGVDAGPATRLGGLLSLASDGPAIAAPVGAGFSAGLVPADARALAARLLSAAF